MRQSFKIDKSNVEEILSLAPMQEGMLFHYLKDPDSEQYFEQLSLRILGGINMAIFEKAWNFVTSKNEMLRALFRWEKLDKPVQIILKKYNTKILTYDFCCNDISESVKKLCDIKIEDKNNKFDLREVPFRVTLCKLAESQYEMIVTNHHILYDGWSTGVIIQDFLYAYDTLGKDLILEKIERFKTKEFIKYFNEKNKKLEQLYWKGYLADFEGKNLIQMKLQETPVRKLEQYSFDISHDFTTEINLFTKDKKITLAELVYCAWGILLQKYTNRRDIVFGTTVSGRNTKIKGIENAVGLFINTLPLRIKSNGEKSMLQLLDDVKKSVRERELYETASLVDIKKYSGISGKQDLFDSLVVVENYPLDNLLNKKERLLNIVAYSIEEQTNYPLTLSINRLEYLKLTLTYDKAFMSKEYVRNMSEHFINVLKFIIKESQKSIAQINILTEIERNQILYEFNDTKADYSKNKTIQELFEEQAEKTPNNIAVVFEDKELTYKELNKKSNSLARVLRAKGIKSDSIVGIMVERSLEMIVGIIAILKAGGAYLPIDPEYPMDRINYMLEDSKTNILLTQNMFINKISFDREIIDLENEKKYMYDTEKLENINTTKDLAYVIYTSGSTGKPKGVMIQHDSVINTLCALQEYYPMLQDDSYLLKTNYTFDVSVSEIFTWVLCGSKLVILPQGKEKEVKDIVKAIDKYEITHVNFTPSMLKAFVNLIEEKDKKELKSLKYIFSAGEVIQKEIINATKQKLNFIQLENLYGPTEATVYATKYTINNLSSDVIPIGKPINNTRCFILDERNSVVPIGVVGELFLGGAGLARGYLNKSELTSEKFIENPFISGERMYKTGDLARWLPDGNIEFLGRIDHQVKIRGFRIELGEIENHLLNYEPVKEVVVIDRDDKNGDKYLCAYMICTKEVIVGELRRHLLKDLPEYMIPSYFIQLKKMPLTSSGKIDRKVLPEPDGSIAVGTEYEGARNEVEEKLIDIWSEVLDVESIGINHNFFDLGGHSLKATTLVSKIHKILNVEVPLKEIFKSPTIKGISEYIQSTEKNIYQEIKIVEEKEYYEVSSAQKRMYMLQQLDLQGTSYNMSGVLEVEGKLDIERLEIAFSKLIERHQSLRTSFENIQGEIVQRISNEINFKVDYVNIEKTTEEAALDREKLINSFVRTFDLSKAPLLRVGIIMAEKTKHIIMFDMHHIISDGVSMGILTKEFAYFYDGKELEKIKVQYKDFSAWQNNFLKSERMKKQEEYWLQNFSGEIPVLNIPLDFTRPSMQSFEGDSINLKLDKNITRELNKVAKETGSTLYMVLLSGINILLSKYSGQEDIVIGSTIAGRPHADLEKIIGMFVNTLAMRNHPEGSKNYKEFLKEVKENALRAYENQDYQFEELVEKLNTRRDISRNPLFDVMFTMQNMGSSKIELKDLRFKQYENSNKIAKFDLTFTAVENSEEISMNIDYCTALFNKKTVERMVEHFRNILKLIVKDANVKISELDMLSESEKNKLLYEFNDTKADYPKDKTIQELFEEQVEKTPNNIAVVYEEEQLTYRELNDKSNSLARRLRSKGVNSDSIVGIMIERSPEMIIGIMSILKAGGAYLPIDPNYPKERKEYMLKDSESHILLSTEALLDNIEFNGQIMNLLNKELFEGKLGNLEKTNSPKDLIYVIYTSGTTGNPKGTMVKHQSFTNLMQWYDNEFEISEKDNVLLMASISFDLAQKNIYAPLIVGGKLTLANRGIINYEKANRIISENKITIINCAPSMFNPIMEFNKEANYAGLKSLKYVFLGGEPINLKKLNDWINSKECFCKIVNTYGPTECTDIATFYRLKKEEIISVPIGKSINNVKLYILDKDKRLVPVGVQGELYIAGDGLSRGYLNRPELTVEKFVENPFELGTKIYKTGDLTKWLPDGNIEFLGRIDNQVKIRGFRIELEEIEKALLKHEDIKEAAIVVKENKENEKYICAYVVCEKEINELNIRSYLKEGLPEYMIPAYFVQLEKMPLTQNGKLDKKALPEPSLDATLNEYEAPINEIEEKLVKMWSEVLGIERIGISDNFFELGGHSLKATTLVSKIHKNLNVEVPLKEIFKSPTIKEISEYIQNTEKNIYQEIKIVEEKEYYAVSSAQKRMYMLQQFDLTSTSYNMPGVLEVEGILDIEKLENAFSKLLERHQTLRTSFQNIEGEIVQKVSSNIDFKVDYVNIQKTLEEVDLDKEKLINSFVRAFDLSKAPLLRVRIVRTENTKHIMMFDMHHIISDGVSMGILTKEFAAFYDGEDVEKIKVQYKDFSAWQNDFLKSEKMKKQEEYWLQNFSGEIPVLNMPMDFTRPSMQRFEGDCVSFKLGKEITRELNKVAKETGSTLYMVLLSSINILISKYSGQEDIVIGSTIAGRPHADLEKIIGMFVNALAMRNHPEGSKTYKDFLQEVKENALRAYENQDYQFEELVEKLSIRRDISRNPLFDVMFTMQNMDSSEIELRNLTLKEYKTSNKVAKFDLTFLAFETSEEISIDIDYCTALFKKETVERMVEHFANILKSIAKDINIKISELNMLSESEKSKLLYEFNDTYTDYPRNKTIHQIFEEQVERTPDNIAVVFEDKQLTYRELNEKSNKLAKTLREKGVKPDTIVGVMLERSLEMLVGVIGILKSGGAFLPVAPEYPKDRISHMLEDSNVNILLTQTKFVNKIEFNGKIINLEEEEAYSDNIENLEHINSSKDLVYVLYTSGSTGKPKGAMIEHKGLINTLNVLEKSCPVSDKDSYLLKTNCVFDVSVIELFTWFFGSGKLVILPNGLEKEPISIAKTIQRNNVTHINFTPSMVSVFFNSLNEEYTEIISSLKYIILGGEAVQKENIEKIRRILSDVNIENIYGPTEFSIFVTRYSIKDLKSNIPIGPPINNTKCYILDGNKKMQPIGVVGELCLCGDGESRGYVNRPELTAEKFVEDPFNQGKLMYKTGDLARWLPDGNIEFLGRIDHQVKIRGFRIELGEIENQLLNYESVKEVVVIDRKDKDGDKYLCAYITCHKEVIVSELREHLLKNLPEYMVPSYFIQLEEMPLTSNGKVDRKALPEPDRSIAVGTECEGARNEVEEKLIAIWSEVLDVDSIGINHNFFDLGGHSLKATTLVSRIHRELNVQVPLKEIFKSPTIKGISEFIQDKEKNAYEQIKIVEEKEYYEVSSAQKRMYMLQQFDLTSTSYNMPGVLEVEGILDIEKLENAFSKLIERHQILRTSFENIEGEIVQKVSSNIDFKVDYVDIEKTIEAALHREILKLDNYQHEKVINEEMDKLISSFVKAFDLSKAPLLRVGVIKVSEEKHIMMFDMHHIISDGVSMGILTREFAALYDGKDLEKIKVQYKDFSAWQNDFLKSEKMKKQEEYWLQNFSGEIPVLNMPMDFTRPSMQRFEGDCVSFKLGEEITRELNKVAKETGSTMYMVLLSGVNILLSKYSGQEDIVIGSPIAGRPHADLEKIIGMFVNTLAMRNHPEGSKNYKEFLKEVKENALRAYENQDYQFEELVEKLNIRRDMSRNPLFDVMFTMQNMDSSEIKLKDLKLKEYKNNKIAKFDLTFIAAEIGEELLVDINYCTQVFKKETVERIVEHFKNILKVVATNTSIELSEIEMLSEAEKSKLLYEFNDTYAAYPRDKTLHQLFEEQVEKTPDKVAVVFEDKQLTYRELNEKSNGLARTLREKGVKQDSVVGIMVQRSLEMIVGIMGILKAGGAYLPIDPEYPEDRVKYMLEDSKANILLTENAFTDKVIFSGIIIDVENEEEYSDNIDNLQRINAAIDLAYVIYTSGSTGKPKGVMLQHDNASNILFALQEYYPLLPTDCYLLKTNYTFDVSVSELFSWFLSGSKLVILSRGKEKDVTDIIETINKYGITHVNFTPSMLKIFIKVIDESSKKSLKSLKYIFSAGEAIQRDTVKTAKEILDFVQLENLYGPTEAAVYTTKYSTSNLNNEIVPIGKPINNVKCFILDKNNKMVPISVVGELYITGLGLARGYLNRGELTSEKFIDNPFKKGQKMYKTGDLARWLPDGNIEFLGRIDHQVKIRGFRIELGEIENQLLNYEPIKEVVVIDRKDKDGDQYLCAYMICTKEVTVSELREHLLKDLPKYMLPSYFVQLEKMPLTSNGKINRKALPEPDGNIASGKEYEGPRNEVEEKMVRIWKEVLSVEKIGINDDFFELGGHSLKATALLLKIHKELDVEVPLKEIFKSPTIKGMSQYIESTEKNKYNAISKIKEQNRYPVSRAQKRLLIFNELNKQDISYNMPMILSIDGVVDVVRLEESVKKLIERHEVFRTSFEFKNGEPVQKVSKNCDFKLNVINVNDKDVENTVKELIVPFKLNEAPLLRVNYIKTKDNIQILMLDVHHIISDGISMKIINKELLDIYEGNSLSKIDIQYKDYSVWQNNYLNSEYITKLENYWVGKIKDFSYTNLPQKAGVSNMRFEGGSTEIYINKELNLKIERLCTENSITKFTYFASLVNIILMNEIAQNDITVGIPVAGRNHNQLQSLIGLFLNVLIIRTTISKNQTFKEYLHVVNENIIEALNNQDYPYEELYDIGSKMYGLKNESLFSIMLNYMPYEDSEEKIKAEGITFKPYNMEQITPKYEVTFYVTEGKDDVRINMIYKKHLFEEEMMERISKAFDYISNIVLENENIVIKKIAYNQTINDEEIIDTIDDDFEIYFENEEFF